VRIETIPLVLGILVVLFGLAMIFDAWTPDDIFSGQERRRKSRVERDRLGEGAIGLGVACMGATFMGRDVWRFRTLSVIVGTVLLLVGIVLNRSYLRAVFTNRGALRRAAQTDPGGAAQKHPVGEERPRSRTR
jgi:uncharacterized membrane protein HdeD (DUF308 family)